MSVLDRKLKRDLIGARATLIAILLVIVAGIGCFVTLTTSYNNLSRSQREYYAQCRMADFSIELKKAPLAEVARIAELPSVAEIRPRIVFNATIDIDNVLKPISGQVISLPDEPRPIINDIVQKRGSYFTGERLEEVIVNDAFARARKIHPGSTIHVILNNRRQALFVVGTAISSEFVYLIGPGSLAPDPENYGVLYVKDTFAEEALDFDGACNQIVGLLTPDVRDHPQRVLDEMERMLDDYGVFSTTPRSLHLPHMAIRDEINGLRVSAVVTPLIFLAVAALVLNILMMRLAQQQRVTVGTLKALGYSDRTITWHFLKFAAVIGLLGGLLGIALGLALAEGHIRIYRMFYEFPRLENRPFPPAYVGAIFIGVLFSSLGALRGVRSIVKLKPAEAMRAQPPAEGGAIALERWRGLWNRLNFRWQMVARTVWRNKWRTAVSMFAAAMGSAIILLAFNTNVAMERLLEHQFELVIRSDFDLSFRDDLDSGAVLEAQKLPGVDYVEPMFAVACEFINGHHRKRSGITGIMPDATLTAPRRADGSIIEIPPTGLIMSRHLARLLEVAPGDNVTFKPVRGLREPVTAPVTRLSDSYIGMATYASLPYLNRLVGEADAVSSVQLKIRPGFAHRLALYRQLKQLPAVQAVNDNEQTKRNLTMLLDTMKGVMSALIIFAAVIYSGSILTTSLVSVAERRREIATFLVMGYDKLNVGGIFLRESLLVNLLGTLFGLPLGYLLMRWMVVLYDTEFYRFPLVTQPDAYLLTVLLAVVFIVVAHLFVQRAINRLNWQEALNAKE